MFSEQFRGPSRAIQYLTDYVEGLQDMAVMLPYTLLNMQIVAFRPYCITDVCLNIRFELCFHTQIYFKSAKAIPFLRGWTKTLMA